ncbi:uncharacterized protein G2W53_032094 [Senna tora]|uniref:Uncharacterized protein n=1 Tax=Senna tora TaxID=362788 RepID=A0A834SV74_9FABA|nr:uncharacterized protein G2W53_032094 [Senna tora]
MEAHTLCPTSLQSKVLISSTLMEMAPAHVPPFERPLSFISVSRKNAGSRGNGNSTKRLLRYETTLAIVGLFSGFS